MKEKQTYQNYKSSKFQQKSKNISGEFRKVNMIMNMKWTISINCVVNINAQNFNLVVPISVV